MKSLYYYNFIHYFKDGITDVSMDKMEVFNYSENDRWVQYTHTDGREGVVEFTKLGQAEIHLFTHHVRITAVSQNSDIDDVMRKELSDYLKERMGDISNRLQQLQKVVKLVKE
jgi:hypothetical protein